jgi:hypothetical protein
MSKTNKSVWKNKSNTFAVKFVNGTDGEDGIMFATPSIYFWREPKGLNENEKLTKTFGLAFFFWGVEFWIGDVTNLV